MSLLNSAKKIYIGNQEVKRVFLRNTKPYKKFDILANFGTSSLLIDPEFSYGVYTQAVDYIDFTSYNNPGYQTFAGYFNVPFSLTAYDEIYFRIQDPTPPMGPTEVIDVEVTFYNSDLGLSTQFNSNIFRAGGDLQLTRLLSAGEIIPSYSIDSVELRFSSLHPQFTGYMRLHDIVGVKNN